MMKSKYIYSMIFLLFIPFIYAQSDYKVVQDFKKEVQNIEQLIKNADSSEVMEKISADIDKLSSKYESRRKLLDNSLYPENFEKTINRLRNSVTLRGGDFSRITELKTTVTTLQVQIDTLKVRNDELSRRFDELESQNKTQVAQLQKIISELRSSLQKRDQILLGVIKDILPTDYQDLNELSSQEKQEIVSRAEQKNILSNIKKAINDNIRFLDATNLYPADLRDVKAQYQNFSRIWNNAGSKIVDLYAARGQKTAEVEEIKAAFNKWNEKINDAVWASINADFASSNIRLRKFSGEAEFINAVTSYIGDEIMNAEAKGEDKAQQDYKNFDSTWSNKIKPAWMSFLLDNKMISEKAEDSIDVRLASWNDAVYPEKFNWLYVVIGVLVLALIVVLFHKRAPRKTENSTYVKS
jgi:DNA-directed RNA polymerase subunit F